MRRNNLNLTTILSYYKISHFAGTVVFLASSASDYITGQTIVVDGGWLAS